MLRRTLLGLAASFAAFSALNAQDKPAASQPGSPAYLDALDGFRGVKFGSEFSKFTDLVVDQDRGKLKLYTKKGENLTFGLAKLTTIVYHFFDGKFYGVSLHATDIADTRTLVAIASTGMGAGEKLDGLNTIWQGETCWAQLSQNPSTGEGTLFIGNCELSRQLGAYEQKAALEAAAQL